MHAPSDRLTSGSFERNGHGTLEEQLPAMTPGASSRTRLAAPREHRVRFGKPLLLLAILLGAGLVLGLVPRMLHRRQIAAETKELAIPTVSTVLPAPSKNAEPLILSGELRPLAEATISARASGYVRRWLVDIGAHVEAGQLLAELDTPEIDRQLNQSRAELKQAEAAQELARTTAKRWTQMLTGKSVSTQEAEEKTGDLSLKQAAVEAAAANVQRLQELTGFAKITAPFAGTVTVRNLDVGQLVEAGGGRELFRVAQTEKLRVYARIPQSYVQAVREGQKAQLTVPEMAGRVFEATVVRSAGAIDSASRTLLTELEVDNTKGELLAGSYAQVRLTDSQMEASLTIPSNCLLFRAQGPQVGVVDAAHHVDLRAVVVGRDFGPTVEILKGIAPNEHVILNPPDAIVAGSEVRVNDPVAPVKKG